MKEFKGFGDFAAHLKTLPKIQEKTVLACATKLGEIIKETARDKIGDYQSQAGPFNAWAELAKRTKEERVELGYSENDPLLRSGELRDSISFKVARPMPWLTMVVVGSESDIAEYQELGTNKIPPRAFLGPAMFEHQDMVNHMLGNATLAVLSGMPFKV